MKRLSRGVWAAAIFLRHRADLILRLSRAFKVPVRILLRAAGRAANDNGRRP